MKKYRLKKPFRVLLYLLAFLIIVVVFYTISKPLFASKDVDTEKKEDVLNDNTIEVNKNEEIIKDDEENITEDNDLTFDIDLIDYQVYKDEENVLGFDFVIARMRIKAEKGIDYNLANLKTDEGIILNNTKNYALRLENNNYYLSSENVIFDKIKDDNSSITFKVFIPYEKAVDNLLLNEAITQKEFLIDLSNNNISVKTIKYEPDSKEIDDPSGLYSISVSDCFVSSMMLENDITYNYPSSNRIYTFKLNINRATNGIYIENAQFVQESTANVYWAMGEDFSSEKYDNIIGKNLADINNAVLFFEVEDMSSSGMDSSGKLCIKFSSSDEWIEVSTKLR